MVAPSETFETSLWDVITSLEPYGLVQIALILLLAIVAEVVAAIFGRSVWGSLAIVWVLMITLLADLYLAQASSIRDAAYGYWQQTYEEWPISNAYYLLWAIGLIFGLWLHLIGVREERALGQKAWLWRTPILMFGIGMAVFVMLFPYRCNLWLRAMG